MLKRILTNKSAFSRNGLLNIALYVLRTKVLNRYYSSHRRTTYRISKLNSKTLLHPVLFRYNSSDASVFSQIFIQDEYGPIEPLQNVRFIIDCGANVGYSSAYFLSRFPHSQVIAIEPDPSNYELLKRNLAPYGRRVTTICSAVWSHKTRLKVNLSTVGDCREWATTVREAVDNEAAGFDALDIDSLLAMTTHQIIDILKIDIEGAEAEIFGRNFETWLAKTRIIAIELHGRKCREVFDAVISALPYKCKKSGELTIAERT
jgi:FkbM family methyltransferase